MSRGELKLDLSRIVFIGRTFEEYMMMFNLSEEDLLGRKILDCASGACSFTAQANQLGANVTATDIAYYHPLEQLERKGREDIEHTLGRLDKAQSNYAWDYFHSVEDLKKTRMRALGEWSKDYIQCPWRYVPAVLPVLPFMDQAFDLTLSAHFLFMYADRLDYEFHEKTMLELMRVSKEEIRIFPLVDLASQRYEYMDILLSFIDSLGWSNEEVQVPYEFQNKANRMLRIKRKNNI